MTTGSPSIGTTTFSHLVDRLRLSGLLLASGVLYLAMAISLVLQWSLVRPSDVGIVLGPLVVAALSFLLLQGVARGVASTVAALVLVGLVLAITPPAGFHWPPIASLAFAASLVAVCSLPTPWALLTMAAGSAAAYVGAVAADPHTLLISTTLLSHWVTPLSTFTLSLSFLVIFCVWQREAARADAAASALRDAEAQVVLGEQVDRARRSVDRRLHETLLNTLAVLSHPTSDSPAIRAQCRADLDGVSRRDVFERRDVPGIVAEAIRRVPALDITVAHVASVDVDDLRTAHILRDALVELLRNVERHSGQSSARVEVTATESVITATVSDRGRGLAQAQPRFGLREAAGDSIASVGGTVSLTSGASGGTQVTLTLPLHRDIAHLRPMPSLDILLGSPLVRLAFAPTAALGLVAVPFAAADFLYGGIITASFAAMVIALLALALGWNRVPRLPTATALIALALITMALAYALQQGCMTAVSMHWIIYSVAGSVMLALLAIPRLSLRALATGIVVAASVAVALSAPSDCRTDGLDAAVENAIWLIGVVSLTSAVVAAVDRRRRAEMSRWQAVVTSQGALAAEEAALVRWDTVNDATWTLLEGVAHGEVDPQEATAQHRARVQGARLRCLLDVASLPSPHLRADLELVIEAASGADVPITVECFDHDRDARVGEHAIGALQRLAMRAAPASVRVSVLPGTILCDVPSDVELPDGWEALSTSPTGRSVFALARS